MIFSDEILVRMVFSILGISGFLVAKHIRDHKVKAKHLVCMVGFDCHAVVHSDYSKFFGIPVEILGMVYYLFIALSYFCLIFFSNMVPNSLTLFVATSSFLAFLFSMYLIAVQFFVLKKGCSWCFVSAFISIAIFVLTIYTHDFSFMSQIF